MKKRIASIFMIFMLCICMLVPLNAQASDNPVPEAKKSVVSVFAGIYYEDGIPYSFNADGTAGSGTGFGVGKSGEDADTFITNWHVVCGSDGVYPIVYIQIDGADIYNESTMIKADVVYYDSEVDIAIIQTEDPVKGVPTIPLLPAEKMETGEEVYALGFPGIADAVADSNNYTVEDITVTDGILSRYLTSGGVKWMAHTAKINHGNSGGPLINSMGQVVGINSNGITDVENADARYYAIYIDYAMEAMDDLGIEYTKAEKGKSVSADSESEESESMNMNLIIIGVAAVAAVVIVVLIIVLASKGSKKQTVVQPTPQPTPQPRPQPAPQPVYQQSAPQPRPQVVYQQPVPMVRAISGPLTGNTWQLKGVLTIGRDPAGSIVYPADTKGISRAHCRLDLQGAAVVITDLGSTYGTFVNGRKLNPNESVRIDSNTEISLGGPQVKLLLC